MTKYTYEEMRQESELVAELSNAVRHQIYGEMDWFRALRYWEKRIPELLEHSNELAEALTYALDRAASRSLFGVGEKK